MANFDKNLENIRRSDQFASKLIEHCTHAALFDFSIEQNKWLKTEVDGPLFIYERLDRPLYSMIVVNRQSPKNFIEPITDGLQLRYEPPYIFVHRKDGCIKGVWVYGEDECKRVFDTLNILCAKLATDGQQTPQQQQPPQQQQQQPQKHQHQQLTPPMAMPNAATPSVASAAVGKGRIGGDYAAGQQLTVSNGSGDDGTTGKTVPAREQTAQSPPQQKPPPQQKQPQKQQQQQQLTPTATLSAATTAAAAKGRVGTDYAGGQQLTVNNDGGDDGTTGKTAPARASVEQIMEKMEQLEMQQKQQHENLAKALANIQNDLKTIMEKFVKQEEKEHKEKEQKEQMKKTLANFRLRNFWDAGACHENIEIFGNERLAVRYKGNDSNWCSVFAKHSITLNNVYEGIFYFEIYIKQITNLVSFGFASKKRNKLQGSICSRTDSYAFNSEDYISINGLGKRPNANFSFRAGDVVGIGAHLANRQLIFTKNGLRLDSSNLFVDASSAVDELFPFVSLGEFGDEIEANFGPNFKFDLPLSE